MAWVKALPAILGAAVIAALLSLVLWYRSEYHEAAEESAKFEAQNAGLLKINADQGAAIARLTNQLQIDNKFSALFAATMSDIQAQSAQVSAALSELQTNDADAKTFLDTRVPDSVKRLYRNGSDAGTGSADRKR